MKTFPIARSGTAGVLLVISFCWQGVAHPAEVQTDAGGEGTKQGGLEEITVTARKRTESLLNVPVAVSVVSAGQLLDNDATDLSKIAELAPQTMIGNAPNGTGAVLTIRGVSSSSTDSGIEQSVSMIIDGVQLNRGRILYQSMFDVQQVEVLEGPQALFFGKNSPAGVIAIKSVEPTSSLEGYLRAGYEFEADERFVQGAISGPLADTFKVRFAFRGSEMDGWIRNVARPQPDPFAPGIVLPGAWDRSSPAGRNFAGRLIAEWTPREDFTAALKVTGGGQRINGGGAYGENYCAGGVTVPKVLGVPDLQSDCSLNMQKAESALPAALAVNYPYANGGIPYNTSTVALASLTLNEQLSGVTLTSVTGYYGQTIADSGVYDESSYAQVYDAEYERYRLITEELRATTDLSLPVNLSAGAYFDHSTRNHLNQPFLRDVGVNPATGSYAAFAEWAWNGGKTYSVFGQLRWNILESLELAGGARWTYETKDLTIGNTSVNPAYAKAFRAVGDFIQGGYSDHNVSPEASLTWHPRIDSTVYVAYKTGYKSGGLSNNAVLMPSYNINTLRFGHELSKGEEIGYKSELLNRSLRFELTAYRYNYSGLQVSAYVAPVNFFIVNAANARIQGVEGSLDWEPGGGLEFNGAFGYNRARYLSFPGAQCYGGQTAAQGCVGKVQDLAGKPLLRAPNVTFNLGGRYELPLWWSWAADLSLEGAYSGSYATEEDQDPLTNQGAFWRLNAAVRFHRSDNAWELAVIGRDLTNSYYIVEQNPKTFGGLHEYYAQMNRPREVIVQVGYHF